MAAPQDNDAVAAPATRAQDRRVAPLATDGPTPASTPARDAGSLTAIDREQTTGRHGDLARRPSKRADALRAEHGVQVCPAAPEPPAPAVVRLLRQLILDEVVVKVLGLPAHGLLRRLANWLLHIPAQRFAELGAGFDVQLARGGFASAARWLLPHFVCEWRAYGAEHVPRQGPLLVVANHPGTYDVLVVAAHLPRADLKVVAGGITFLQAFSAAERGLIFAGRDYAARATALRATVRHLETGGALLTFPSENIDPDPERAAFAPQELERWSPSVEWVLRHVPRTSVVVAIVSGVVARGCYHHPLTLLRREAADRRRVASLIQMAGQLFLGRTARVVPKVSYAAPVNVPGQGTREDVGRAMQAVLARAQDTLVEHLNSAV